MNIRKSVPVTMVHLAIAAGLVPFNVACTQQAESEKDVTQVGEELYLTGTTWPGSVVFVCYDGVDGNSPTLIAAAQRVLAASWSRASNLVFVGRSASGQQQSNWAQCDTSPRAAGNFSTIALHFCGGSSTGSNCPVASYDNNVRAVGGFRGQSPNFGPVPPSSNGHGLFQPGLTNVSIISDDPDTFSTRFRYEVIHEFGHATGFEHEMNRPDNFSAGGTALTCGASAVKVNGGTYESPYDINSIMNYCAHDPLTGGFPTMLSGYDIQGIRNVYSRRTASHGFMIKSDTDASLAVNAIGGADEGTVLKLHSACTNTNPDCTWSYQRGMIVSDKFPSLALNAAGGAAEGTTVKLTAACTPSNPDCTWTYKNGQFLSDTDNTLAINAAGGAVFGATLKLTRACTASNPDCTWTLPNVMLSSNRDTTLSVNAFGGAANATTLKMNSLCDPGNTDCTWTFSHGQILSDTNSTLALNAFNGATNGATIKLINFCSSSNVDCTWTWKKGQIISDNHASGTLPIKATGGALDLATLNLNSGCTSTSPDCVFSGLFARN